jgi:hypothetical protein
MTPVRFGHPALRWAAYYSTLRLLVVIGVNSPYNEVYHAGEHRSKLAQIQRLP